MDTGRIAGACVAGSPLAVVEALLSMEALGRPSSAVKLSYTVSSRRVRSYGCDFPSCSKTYVERLSIDLFSKASLVSQLC